MSQMIPIGIGSPADRTRFVLTGLGTELTPPPGATHIGMKWMYGLAQNWVHIFLAFFKVGF